MSVFLRDDFGAGSIDLAKWADAPSLFGGDIANFTLAGGFAKNLVNSSDANAQGIDAPPSPDYYVECQVTFPADSASAIFFGGRYDDGAGDCYMVEANYVNATHIRARVKAYAGFSPNQLNFGSDIYLVADATSVNIRLAVVGAGLELFLDGVTAGTWTDSTVAAAGFPYLDLSKNNTHVCPSVDWFGAGDLTIEAFWTHRIKATEIDS